VVKAVGLPEVMENKSGDDHPIHLPPYLEITRIGGKTTSGIRKDTVNVPRRQNAEIDFVADDPDSLSFTVICSSTRFGFIGADEVRMK